MRNKRKIIRDKSKDQIIRHKLKDEIVRDTQTLLEEEEIQEERKERKNQRKRKNIMKYYLKMEKKDISGHFLSKKKIIMSLKAYITLGIIVTSNMKVMVIKIETCNLMSTLTKLKITL